MVVGYILPIDHNDYKNYQHRMEQGVLGLHHVKKTYKVILESKNKKFFDEGIPREVSINDHPINKLNKIDIARITGKGMIFSKKI